MKLQSLIELWFEDSQGFEDTEIVSNAPCVPREGETIDLKYGKRRVSGVKYDFHPTDGNVRIHIDVVPISWEQQ